MESRLCKLYKETIEAAILARIHLKEIKEEEKEKLEEISLIKQYIEIFRKFYSESFSRVPLVASVAALNCYKNVDNPLLNDSLFGFKLGDCIFETLCLKIEMQNRSIQIVACAPVILPSMIAIPQKTTSMPVISAKAGTLPPIKSTSVPVAPIVANSIKAPMPVKASKSLKTKPIKVKKKEKSGNLTPSSSPRPSPPLSPPPPSPPPTPSPPLPSLSSSPPLLFSHSPSPSIPPGVRYFIGKRVHELIGCQNPGDVAFVLFGLSTGLQLFFKEPRFAGRFGLKLSCLKTYTFFTTDLVDEKEKIKNKFGVFNSKLTLSNLEEVNRFCLDLIRMNEQDLIQLYETSEELTDQLKLI